MNRREEYVAFLLAGISSFQPKRGNLEDQAGDCLDYAEYVANGAMAMVDVAEKDGFTFEEEEEEDDRPSHRDRGRRR